MTSFNTENLNLIQPHLPRHFSKSGINSEIILVSLDHWVWAHLSSDLLCGDTETRSCSIIHISVVIPTPCPVLTFHRDLHCKDTWQSPHCFVSLCGKRKDRSKLIKMCIIYRESVELVCVLLTISLVRQFFHEWALLAVATINTPLLHRGVA